MSLPTNIQDNTPTLDPVLDHARVHNNTNTQVNLNTADIATIQAELATAGGDLSGSYPNPTVAKINGIAVSGTPTTGQVLTATGAAAANWQNAAAATGTLLAANNLSDVVSPATAFGNIKQSATGGATGVLQLSGDLGGTATSPQVTGLHLAADTNIGHKLTNVTDPGAAQDVATKNYVDGVAAGLSVKVAVNEATTAALPANTYNNGTAGVGATLTENANGVLVVDGVTVAVNDRILVKDEAAPANNGIYTVTATGDAGNPYILTRAVDNDQSTEIKGAFTFVETGTTNAGGGWVVVGAGPWTIGTTAINWTQFSAGALSAGAGLSLTGTVMSVNAGSGITLGGGTTGVDFTAVQAKNANLDAVSGLATTGLISRTGSGTAVARTLTAASGKITVTNGDGVAGNPTINLGTVAESDITGLVSDLGAKMNNPMTTLGDLAYGGISGNPVRLAGDTSGALKILTSTGSGGVATAPTWTTPSSSLLSDGANLVTLTGAQTVTGAKTFNAGALLDKGNQVFNIMAYEAKCDDSTDDLAAVNAAIAAAKATGKGGIIYVPGPTRVSDTVLVDSSYIYIKGDHYNRDYSDFPIAYPGGTGSSSPNYLIGSSHFKVTASFPSGHPLVQFGLEASSSSDPNDYDLMGCGIEGMNLIGNNGTPGTTGTVLAGHGLELNQTHDFRCRDNVVQNTQGTGIYAISKSPGGISLLEVTHCLVRAVGGYGIHFAGGLDDGNSICHNYVTGVKGFGIIIDGGQKNVIRDNYVNGVKVLGGDSHPKTGTGIYTSTDGQKIYGNVVTGTDYHGIYIDSRQASVFGNTVEAVNQGNHSDGAGIWDSGGTSHVVVANNIGVFDPVAGVEYMKYGIVIDIGAGLDSNGLYSGGVASDNVIYNPHIAPVHFAQSSTATQVSHNFGVNPRKAQEYVGASGAITIDRINGDLHAIYLAGDVTVTINDGLVPGDVLTLMFYQNSPGGYNVTFAGTHVNFDGNTFHVDPGSGGLSTISFICYNRTNVNWIEIARSSTAGTKEFSSQIVLDNGLQIHPGSFPSAIVGNDSNMTISGPTGGNIYLAPAGTDGTKVSMSDGSIRIGGPGQLTAKAHFTGSTSGTTDLKASAVAGATVLTLPAATDTLVGRATIDTLTNKTIDGASNTLTNTGLTQGSVLFMGASGVYSQDNTNLFWDATNHRLGVGINASLTDGLHVATSARFNSASLPDSTTNPGVYLGRSGGTPRVLFANGTAAQNWEMDNNGGTFRWFLPGTTYLSLDTSNLTLGTNLALNDGKNFAAGTTTGTKIGTATNQKLSFFNSTPVVQQTGDIATALQNLGLVASPTVSATISFATLTKFK